MPHFQKPLIILFFIFSADSAFSSDCGLFRVVKGDVKFQKKGKTKFKKARINKKVCAGDLVKTNKDSRAKIVLASLDEINISPETELQIQQLKNKQVQLTVNFGKIRSKVKSRYEDNDKSHYRVTTKSAVAGVRGTDFLTGYNKFTNESSVVTFEGQVAVGNNTNGTYKPNVVVKAGQFTANKPGAQLLSPKRLSPGQLTKIDGETDISTPSGTNESRGTASSQQKKNNKQPKSDKNNNSTKKTLPPQQDGTSNRQPDSVSNDIPLDQEINSIEQTIMEDGINAVPEINVEDLPSLPHVIDSGNIGRIPPVNPGNLIDNVIQNSKAQVIFNVEVKP